MTPKLPYTLHTRYSSIAVAWTIILTPPIFLNITLFYTLWYLTTLDRLLVLTLPTAILGIFTILAILERVYKLTVSSPQYRPVNSPRYALDIFQWGYFGALLLISALISSTLVRGDVDGDNHILQIRLISLPTVVLMLYLAILTLLSLILNAFKVSLPFQFGSSAPGTVVYPAIYYIVEDVVAVDGDGKLPFREAWKARYEGSEVFQGMIWLLSIVWMVAFFALAGLTAGLVMGLKWQAVYAIGWALPFPFVGVLVGWTVLSVRRHLRIEGLVEEVEREENGSLGGDERTPLLNGRVEVGN